MKPPTDASLKNPSGTGWALGFGVILAPWLIAGVISTFLPNPESTFPSVFVAVFLFSVAWTVWAGVRHPALRRQMVLGASIAVAGVAALVALLWWGSPSP